MEEAEEETMISTVMTKCRQCDGHGEVEHPQLTQAYRFLLRSPWARASAVAKDLGISLNGANNLTARLHDMDLVERRGQGNRHHPFEWRVKR
jgi:hypothetical protein